MLQKQKLFVLFLINSLCLNGQNLFLSLRFGKKIVFLLPESMKIFPVETKVVIFKIHREEHIITSDLAVRSGMETPLFS